jgi:hypothetical protein
MKNKIQIKSVKLLLNSNLLIFKQTSKNDYTSKYLDPIEFFKNLKQFIRILQFLKNCKHGNLYLEADNFTFKEIFSVVKFNRPKITLKTLDSVFKNEELEKENSVSLVLHLTEKNYRSNFVKQLFLKQLFLLQFINCNYNKNDLGFYKMYNSVSDLKKNLFFILLLKKNL